MSAIAEIKNGQVVETTTISTQKSNSNSSLDKDAFLQLLVAQMKYQDPLQPTSNTEYISQLATFSELEEMQNLNSGMTLQRASSLVGQYVFMKVTDGSGNTTNPEGKVDYVVYENNKAYLSINETLYSIDDLDTVADSNYLTASRLAEEFAADLNKLPNVGSLTQSDLEDVEDIIISYESMTDYQREFLNSDTTSLYESYVSKFQELAVTPVSNFISALGNLPAAEEMTMDNAEEAKAVIDTYNNLSTYQKSLIDSETLAVYQAMEAQYKDLTTA